MRQTTSPRQVYVERRKVRRRSALFLSLILHMVVAIIYLFIPQKEVNQESDSIAIEWVKDIPEPKIRKLKTKPPLKVKVYKPNKRLAREAKNKLSESSPHKITEVVRLSERVVYENVEVNKAPPSDTIPELMTDADLREAQASNLERLVSQPGRTDGQGVVTGRVRVRGQGKGRFLVDSYGNAEDGLLGGGGNPGIADPLDIIRFLNEFEGPQQVVYCLDVSASMQAAGLKQLELAVKSINDSMLMLGEDDHFNVITFSRHAKVMNQSMLVATMDNVRRASTYLNRFTPTSILGNTGTNLLEAVEKALELDPTIIMLVTDGLPTAGGNKQDVIETDPQKILEIVTEKNVNQASIFVVGLEIDLRHSPGGYLLVSLADQNNGKLKIVNNKMLVEYAHPEPKTQKPSELKTPDL